MTAACNRDPGWQRRGAGWACRLSALLLFGSLLLGSPLARADSSVTNCTQDALVAALATGGNVTFAQNCSIVLSSTITITTNVTLDASGRAISISGGNSVQLFTVPPGISFTLKGLTLSGGQSTSGGAMSISSGAQVLVTNCVYGGNGAVGVNGVAGDDGGGGNYGQNGTSGTAGTQALGGAIYNLGGLTIYNTSFLTNRAAGGSGGSGGNGGDGLYQGGNGGNGGAGALGYGGAIYSLGTLWLTNCTFIGNTATGGTGGDGGTNGAGAFPANPGRGGAGAPGSGGAVYSAQSLSAFACTFAANVAQSGNSAAGGTDSSGNGVNGPRGPDSLGGGIYLQGSGALNNCTFANNTVTGGIGGNGGDANAVGIHTAGNGGDGGNGMGGGLYNTGAVAVVNCTFSSCGATGGANGLAGSPALSRKDGTPGRGRGGDIAQSSGTFVLRNSILAASFAGTNAYDTSASRITDSGFNISSDASLNLSGTSLKNTDPKVGSLADNGGPTQTIALQTNSPAIDAVPFGNPATDQRGVPRPQGAAGDIGAYELVTLPAILNQPQSQTNAFGTPVTFTVSTLGGSLGYRWRFNAATIANANTASYTISSVDQTNEGSYDVVITNSYGSITSMLATLTVTFPPVIDQQPVSQAAYAGSNATFTVVAHTPPLFYQWQLNSASITGATSSSYTVNAQATNAGSYSVVITNIYGSVTSSPATLTVYAPPFLTVQPADQAVILGSNATFSVTALGAPPLRYQWRFNQTTISSNATSSIYALNSVQAANAGFYDVIITNSFGSTTSRMAALKVVSPFAISGRVVQGTNGLPGVTISVGTNISFTGTGGYFTNRNLPASTNVLIVIPSLAGYAFAPSAQSLVLLSNTSLPDFMAFPSLALVPASNGVFQLTFAPAFTCQVESSTNFDNWQPVFATNNISTNTLLLEFTDTNAVNVPIRFYRVGQTFAGLPSLTGLLATNRSVSLGCVAAPILTCQIEASTDLKTWTSISTNSLPTDSIPFQFTYSEASNSPVRFYRLSQTPGF